MNSAARIELYDFQKFERLIELLGFRISVELNSSFAVFFNDERWVNKLSWFCSDFRIQCGIFTLGVIFLFSNFPNF